MITACYLVEGGLLANLISDFGTADALATCYFLCTNCLVKSNISYDIGTAPSHDAVIVPQIHQKRKKYISNDEHQEQSNRQ